MSDKTEIAIVGMGGVFPGCRDLQEFWRLIKDGKTTVRPVGQGRWLVPPKKILTSLRGEADRVVTDRGFFVDPIPLDFAGLDLDHEFIAQLDPLFHLTLKAGYEAFNDMKWQRLDLARSGIIIGNIVLPSENSAKLAREFFGATFREHVLQKKSKAHKTHEINNFFTSLPAALLARGLKLGGGAFSIDAACASSLYAIKLAADELREYRADMMIAGGVSRPDALYTQMGFSALNALSPSGRSLPFDHRGDGLLVGEGAGMFVLKRLQDALAQKDRIYGLIAGIGISSDIGGSLMAPDSNGQLRAMRAAYKQADWTPDMVDHIECHATGTPVGDRVEIESLRRLWAGRSGAPFRCVLGSVKSNVGHMLTAAGAAGLMKSLLSIHHQRLAPTAGFESYGHHPLANSPFRILQQEEAWEAKKERPRRAAISGFGFGGINAHLLIEEYSDHHPLRSASTFVPETGSDQAQRSTITEPAVTSLVTPQAAPAKAAERQIAVVGIGLRTPTINGSADLRKHILKGESAFGTTPEHWWQAQKSQWYFERYGASRPQVSAYKELEIPFWRYRIPPNELQEMLPQQHLMLLTADDALVEAGYGSEDKLEGGVFIGIGQDGSANHFQCRWEMIEKFDELLLDAKITLTREEYSQQLKILSDALWPPLNANRTMGALGGVVGSRIAREFRFGGSGYTVAADENSGGQALAVALRAIARGELKMALVGAVDFVSGLESVLCNEALLMRDTPYVDAAVALVLKDLEAALADGNHIYATIRGIAAASSQEKAITGPSIATYESAMHRALATSGIDASQILLNEMDAGGWCKSLAATRPVTPAVASGKKPALVESSTLKELGYTGAAAGLVAIAHAIVNLDILAATCAGTQPLAAVATGAKDGGVVNVVLEGWTGVDREVRKHSTTTPANLSHLKISIGAAHFTPVDLPWLNAKLVKKESPKPQQATIGTQQNQRSASRVKVTNPSQSHERKSQAPKSFQPAISPEAMMTPFASERTDGEGHLSFFPSIMTAMAKSNELDMAAHLKHLDHHYQSVAQMGGLLESQLQTLRSGSIESGQSCTEAQLNTKVLLDIKAPQDTQPRATEATKPFMDYRACRQFARGKIGDVLGSQFAAIDQFPTRVRLPDEPLLLCHRIISVDAEPFSMSHGALITEHDIAEEAWYLDDGQIPVCIAVEAGQADLFLAAYLGADFHTKGQAVYRLLDAIVTFNRALPKVGDVIRYHIKIHEFFSQGKTLLFRFEFEATVSGEPLMSMKNGVAGFFTAEELAAGKGINESELQKNIAPGRYTGGFTPLIPMHRESYDDKTLMALCHGDYATAFGSLFSNLGLRDPKALPGGRMRLVHRVLELDAQGGRYGLGFIRGEADIHPDDWFLTCHFIDDQVMPGTLMYECCFHTFRIFLMRMGWVGEKADLYFEPIFGAKSQLRCRGQVLPTTRKVLYEIMPKQIGYDPAAYAIADAYMYADGKRIVEIKNITVRYPRVNRASFEELWSKSKLKQHSDKPESAFTKEMITAFSCGNPASSFGDLYRPFDIGGRFIARLPRDPYLFLDRIITVDAAPWVMKEGGSLVAAYDVPPTAWYFAAERTGFMPLSVLLEIALQPCGWFAAYKGSALTSPLDLHFRNLGGNARQYQPVTPEQGTLLTRVESRQIARSGSMIIQHYDFSVTSVNGELIYEGKTVFGFFTAAALADQVGIGSPVIDCHEPYQPTDYGTDEQLPVQPLCMVDKILYFNQTGGEQGLGSIGGLKNVDPSQWFFTAHFFQDAVMPGSLGIESMIQLLKVAFRRLFPHEKSYCDHCEAQTEHHWCYRGQVLPNNKQVMIQVEITAIDQEAQILRAKGQLSVDGLLIYTVHGLSLKVHKKTAQTKV